MSFLDVLNSDKDRAMVSALIQEAAQTLTQTIIPAAETAGNNVADHATADALKLLADIKTTLDGLPAQLEQAGERLLDKFWEGFRQNVTVSIKIGSGT